MSDHDMRIGQPDEATPGSDNDPALTETDGPTVSGSIQAPPVGPSTLGGAPEDTPLGSPKGGASTGDTGPGRYGGDQDLQPGDLDPYSAGTMPMGGEQERINRPYTTDASDVSRAAEAREAAHDIGGRWGVDEHSEVH